ncbi:MAG: hypothetical protein OEW35_05735 [Gammaproteobacteria bacterium]|nr:hypothetical protein [Gammaproteobacteria bacterium]MDH4255266.1 hypothetical protein [Gammaproteobacteria bacterium]MDH5309998.1 hypothetical protein [Gammaproteobacteria bacterium]
MQDQDRGAAPAAGRFVQVPRLDVRELLAEAAGRERAARRVLDACRGSGFFCVDGFLRHSGTHARLLQAMREFFDLPASDPRKQAVDVTGQADTRGWMPLFREPAYQPGTLARVESFDVGRPRRASNDAGYLANRWPRIPGFRSVVEEAWHQFTDIGMAVLEALGLALGSEPSFFAGRCRSQDLSTMRLLHYPGVRPGRPDDANVGIAAHTDFECITLISQTAPGLELQDRDGTWHDVPVGPDSIVVLLGDMLERWTNGALRATGHRVRNQPGQRYSVVLFFAVDDAVVVQPEQSLINPGDTPRYAPLRQRDHSRARLAEAEKNRDEYARTGYGIT